MMDAITYPWWNQNILGRGALGRAFKDTHGLINRDIKFTTYENLAFYSWQEYYQLKLYTKFISYNLTDVYFSQGLG